MKSKPILYILICVACHFTVAAQPDFNTIDSVNANKEIDSLAKIYKMDESRARLIEAEKPNDRSETVKLFNELSAEQKAVVMKNRLHQALTVSSLTILQKRVIAWTIKKIRPELYDRKNPGSEEEAKKMANEMMPVISKYFSEQQICLLYTECSLRGIEN